MTVIYIAVFVILFIFCIPFRVVLFHPIKTVIYAARDFYQWLKYKKWNCMDYGYVNCFVGLFGKGKTLASVYFVRRQYIRYNNKRIYDFDRKKWVTQKVNVISNVDLDIPFVPFTGLQQIVDVSKVQKDFDYAHDVYTITLVLGDEFSVQLNSRNFKKNIDPLFLNTLLTCRHHHIAMVYNAQRFGHVDALLRQVTNYVIDCNKLWRIMVHKKYDAWDLENASSPTMCKPVGRFGWFISDQDFAAYDTLACVDNLVKACEEGDMLTEEEILKLQSSSVDTDNDSVTHASRRLRIKRKKNSA
jgi:hypothetical protein